MPELKFEGVASRREARFRALSWGAVLSLLGITVLLFVLGVSGDLSANWNLRWLFVFTLLGTVIGASILACREALRYAQRQMSFVLDGDGVVRKRRGYPEVRIPFSEIDALSEQLGWLIIKSSGPRRKIAIPNSIGGYGAIRAELAKHHPLSGPAAFPLKTTALLVMACLSWGAALWLRDRLGILAAGTVAVVTLTLGSHRLWTLLHRSSKRSLLWASLGFAWLVALVLIYFRVVRA